MHDTASKPPPILPIDRQSDRALYSVIGVFTFLFTMTVLSFIGGMSASANWGQSLKQSISVQVPPTQDNNAQADFRQIANALAALPNVSNVKIVTEQEARALLKPWLGETPLPDDIAIPQLIEVEFDPLDESSVLQIRSELTSLGINAQIDDHNYWLKGLSRKTLIFKSVIILTTAIIILALISAIIFATRAGLSSWRTLMKVMNDIGAEPNFTARLFAKRFFVLSLKAGIPGAILALIFAGFVILLWSGTDLISSLKSATPLLAAAMLCPFVVAILSALTAWFTVHKYLLKRLYP